MENKLLVRAIVAPQEWYIYSQNEFSMWTSLSRTVTK